MDDLETLRTMDLFSGQNQNSMQQDALSTHEDAVASTMLDKSDALIDIARSKEASIGGYTPKYSPSSDDAISDSENNGFHLRAYDRGVEKAISAISDPDIKASVIAHMSRGRDPNNQPYSGKNLTRDAVSNGYSALAYGFNDDGTTGQHTFTNFNQAKNVALGFTSLDGAKTIYSDSTVSGTKIKSLDPTYTDSNNPTRSTLLNHKVEMEHITTVDEMKRNLSLGREFNDRNMLSRDAYANLNSEFARAMSDIYNLMPAVASDNQLRSNYSYGVIPPGKETVSRGGENGIRIDDRNRVIEPQGQQKGVIARARLYMADEYPNAVKLSSYERTMYEQWDKMYPPKENDDEIRKARETVLKQGNVNKYIAKYDPEQYKIQPQLEDFRKASILSSLAEMPEGQLRAVYDRLRNQPLGSSGSVLNQDPNIVQSKVNSLKIVTPEEVQKFKDRDPSMQKYLDIADADKQERERARQDAYDSDGFFGELADRVQSAAYQSYGRAVNWLNEHGITDGITDNEYWKKVADPELGQAYADQWAGVKRSTRIKDSETLIRAHKALSEGDWGTAAKEYATMVPGVIADSLLQMGLIAVGAIATGGTSVEAQAAAGGAKLLKTTLPAVLAAVDQYLIDNEDYKAHNNGESMSLARSVADIIGNTALLRMDVGLVGSFFKGTIKDSALKAILNKFNDKSTAEIMALTGKRALSGILKSALEEAGQEYSQQFFDTAISDDQSNPKSFYELALSQDQIDAAILGGMSGGALASTGVALRAGSDIKYLSKIRSMAKKDYSTSVVDGGEVNQEVETHFQNMYQEKITTAQTAVDKVTEGADVNSKESNEAIDAISTLADTTAEATVKEGVSKGLSDELQRKTVSVILPFLKKHAGTEIAKKALAKMDKLQLAILLRNALLDDKSVQRLTGDSSMKRNEEWVQMFKEKIAPDIIEALVNLGDTEAGAKYFVDAIIQSAAINNDVDLKNDDKKKLLDVSQELLGDISYWGEILKHNPNHTKANAFFDRIIPSQFAKIHGILYGLNQLVNDDSLEIYETSKIFDVNGEITKEQKEASAKKDPFRFTFKRSYIKNNKDDQGALGFIQHSIAELRYQIQQRYCNGTNPKYTKEQMEKDMKTIDDLEARINKSIATIKNKPVATKNSIAVSDNSEYRTAETKANEKKPWSMMHQGKRITIHKKNPHAVENRATQDKEYIEAKNNDEVSPKQLEDEADARAVQWEYDNYGDVEDYKEATTNTTTVDKEQSNEAKELMEKHKKELDDSFMPYKEAYTKLSEKNSLFGTTFGISPLAYKLLDDIITKIKNIIYTINAENKEKGIGILSAKQILSMLEEYSKTLNESDREIFNKLVEHIAGYLAPKNKVAAAIYRHEATKRVNKIFGIVNKVTKLLEKEDNSNLALNDKDVAGKLVNRLIQSLTKLIQLKPLLDDEKDKSLLIEINDTQKEITDLVKKYTFQKEGTEYITENKPSATNLNENGNELVTFLMNLEALENENGDEASASNKDGHMDGIFTKLINMTWKRTKNKATEHVDSAIQEHSKNWANVLKEVGLDSLVPNVEREVWSSQEVATSSLAHDHGTNYKNQKSDELDHWVDNAQKVANLTLAKTTFDLSNEKEKQEFIDLCKNDVSISFLYNIKKDGNIVTLDANNVMSAILDHCIREYLSSPVFLAQLHPDTLVDAGSAFDYHGTNKEAQMYYQTFADAKGVSLDTVAHNLGNLIANAMGIRSNGEVGTLFTTDKILHGLALRAIAMVSTGELTTVSRSDKEGNNDGFTKIPVPFTFHVGPIRIDATKPEIIKHANDVTENNTRQITTIKLTDNYYAIDSFTVDKLTASTSIVQTKADEHLKNLRDTEADHWIIDFETAGSKDSRQSRINYETQEAIQLVAYKVDNNGVLITDEDNNPIKKEIWLEAPDTHEVAEFWYSGKKDKDGHLIEDTTGTVEKNERKNPSYDTYKSIYKRSKGIAFDQNEVDTSNGRRFASSRRDGILEFVKTLAGVPQNKKLTKENIGNTKLNFIGHNISAFDKPLLLRSLNELNKKNSNKEPLDPEIDAAYEFIKASTETDTYIISDEFDPTAPNHKQETLYKFHFGEDLAGAHDADADVKGNAKLLHYYNDMYINNVSIFTSVKRQLNRDTYILQQCYGTVEPKERVYTTPGTRNPYNNTVQHTYGLLSLSEEQQAYNDACMSVAYSVDTELLGELLGEKRGDGTYSNEHELKLSLGYYEGSFVGLYKEQRLSYRGKNNAIDMEVEGIKQVYEKALKGEKVYLPRFLGRNGREYIAGVSIMPQSFKKLQRFLIKPDGSTDTWSTNIEELAKDDDFVFATAQTFDILKHDESDFKSLSEVLLGLNKEQLQEIITSLRTKTNNEAVKDIKELLVKHIKDTSNKEALINLANSIGIENKGQMLSYIQFLRKRIDNEKNSVFDSYLPIEIDAASSGIGVRILQFGDSSLFNEEKGIAPAAGMLNEVNSAKYHSQHSLKKDKLDVYSNAVDKFKDKYCEEGKVTEKYKNKVITKNIQEMRNQGKYGNIFQTTKITDITLQSLASSMVDSVNVLLKSASKARGFFKPPVMTYNYSAGEYSICFNMSDDLLETWLQAYKDKKEGKKLEAGSIEEAGAKFIEQLEDYYNASENEIPTLHEALQKFTLSEIQMNVDKENANGIVDFKTLFVTVFAASFGHTIFEQLKDTFAFDIYNQHMGIITNFVFKTYKELWEYNIKKIQNADGSIDIDKFHAMLDNMQEVLPTLPLPNNIYGNDSSGLLFMKQELSRLASDAIKMSIPLGNGKTMDIFSNPYVPDLVGPKQSGKVIPIHMLDGLEMKFLEILDHQFTSIFDAAVLSAKGHKDKAKRYNEGVWLTNYFVCLPEIMHNMFEKTLEIKRKLEDDKSNDSENKYKGVKGSSNSFMEESILNEFDQAIESFGEAKGSHDSKTNTTKSITYKQFLAESKKLVERVKENKKKVFGEFVFDKDGRATFEPGLLKSIVHMDGAIGGGFYVSDLVNELESAKVTTPEEFTQWFAAKVRGRTKSFDKRTELGAFKSILDAHENKPIPGGKIIFANPFDMTFNTQQESDFLEKLFEDDKNNPLITDTISDEHANWLRKLIGKGSIFDGFKVEVRDGYGYQEANGFFTYDPKDKKYVIQLERPDLKSYDNLSEEEKYNRQYYNSVLGGTAVTYMHERVHALTIAAIKFAKHIGNNKAYRQLVNLFLKVRNNPNCNYKVFLPANFDSITNEKQKAAYEAAAKNTFNYVFGNTHKNTNFDRVLAEFIAYALTDPNLRRFLASVIMNDSSISKNNNNKKLSIIDRIINAIKGLIDVLLNHTRFSDKFTNTTNLLAGNTSIKQRATADNEVLRVFEDLSAINAKYMYKLEHGNTRSAIMKAYKAIARAIDRAEKFTTTQAFTKVFGRQNKGLENHQLLKPTDYLNPKNLGSFGFELLTDPSMRHFVLQSMVSESRLAQEDFLQSIVREMRTPDKDTFNLHDYNVQRGQLDAYTKDIEEYTYSCLLNGFDGSISDSDAKTLKKLILQGNLISIFYELSNNTLLNIGDPTIDPITEEHVKYLKDIISNKDTRQKEIEHALGQLDKILKQKGGYAYKTNYLNQIRGLAYSMDTGRWNLFNFTNAEAIANKIREHNDEVKAIVNKLVSLYYLDRESIEPYRQSFKELNDVGVATYLNTFKSYSILVKGELNKDTRTIVPSHAVTGYTQTVRDYTTDIIVDLASNKDKLAKQGYDVISTDAFGDPTGTDDQYYVYSRRFVTPHDKRSGSAIVMAGVDNTIRRLISDTNNLLGSWDYTITPEERNTERLKTLKHKREKIEALYNRELTEQDFEKLSKANFRPEYTWDGKVSDYILTLDNEAKENIIHESTDGLRILSAMMARQDRHVRARDINDQLLEFLYNDMHKNMTTESNAKPQRHIVRGDRADNIKYVKIEENSKDKFIREAWKSLPESFKDAIKEKPLYIREDWKLDLMGVQYLSLADSKFMEKHTSVKTRYAVAIAEQIIKLIAHQAKESIIFKIPTVLVNNILANIAMSVATGHNPARVVKYSLDAIRNTMSYLNDLSTIRKLQFSQKSGMWTEKMNYTYKAIKHRMENNPIHDLYEAGLLSPIVEDMQSITHNDSAQVRKKVTDSKLFKAIPKPVKTTAQELYMTDDTSLFKLMNVATQYSDFIARAAEYHIFQEDYEENTGKKRLEHADTSVSIFKVSEDYKKACNAKLLELRYKFINYDLPTSAIEQYLNDIGLVMFTKYRKRVQWIISKGLTQRPLTMLALLMMETAFLPVSTPLTEFAFIDPTRNIYGPDIVLNALLPGTYQFYDSLAH